VEYHQRLSIQDKYIVPKVYRAGVLRISDAIMPTIIIFKMVSVSLASPYQPPTYTVQYISTQRRGPRVGSLACRT